MRAPFVEPRPGGEEMLALGRVRHVLLEARAEAERGLQALLGVVEPPGVEQARGGEAEELQPRDLQHEALLEERVDLGEARPALIDAALLDGQHAEMRVRVRESSRSPTFPGSAAC